MEIKESLKGIGGTIVGFIIFILIIGAIFGIIYVIKIPWAVTPLSALEAYPEAERIAKEKYAGAHLWKVSANTGTIQQDVSSSYGSDTVTVKTKWSKNPRPLHDDGTAEEWYFSFYSPSEKLVILVNIIKRKSSGKIKGNISTQEIKLSFSERVGLSKEKIEEKEKELQEIREKAIFDPKDWKVDSTEAIDKVSDEFSISRLTLVGQSDGTLTWIANSAKLEKVSGGEWWVEKFLAKIDAVSGEILEQ